jgi:Protein of unknown function (DUF1214)
VFWKLAMHGEDMLFTENDLGRYSIGSTNDGLTYNPDGSLARHLQHDPADNDTARANWLPAANETRAISAKERATSEHGTDARAAQPHHDTMALAAEPVTTSVTTSTPSSPSITSRNSRNLDDLDARRSTYTTRIRLRALWTLWSVEVRVLSGALGKPRTAGLFMFSDAPGVRWRFV